MKPDQRYERNIPSISQKEQEMLASSRVLVVGCGGLGGYLIEYLARLGVGHITAVDGDVFEITNLNRQLYSSPELLGKSKSAEAARRVQRISPNTQITAVEDFFRSENADMLVSGQTLVMDALDNRSSRLLLEDVCEKHGIPLIHGAVSAWTIQVATILPGSRILHRLYHNTRERDCENDAEKSCLSMIPAACAAAQTAEAVRCLIGESPSLNGRLMVFNFQTMEQLLFSIS